MATNNLLTDYEYISDNSVRYNGVTYTVEKDETTGLICKISDSNGNEFEPTINSGITDIDWHNAVFWAVAMARGFEGKKVYGNTNIFEMSNIADGIWKNAGDGYDIVLPDGAEVTDEGVSLKTESYYLPITGTVGDYTMFVVAKKRADFTSTKWTSVIGNYGTPPQFNLCTRDLNWSIGTGDYAGRYLGNISAENYAVLTTRKSGTNGVFFINQVQKSSYNGYITPISDFWHIESCFWFKYIAIFPNAMTDAEITAKIAELMTTYGIGEPEFVADGIMGLFTPETRDIANSRWRNSIFGYNDMTLTGCSASENAVHFTASQYGTFTCDEPNTVYAIVKSEQSEAVNCIITKKLTVLGDSVNHGFNLLQYGGQMYFSAAANDILQPEETALPNTEYHCYCYTRSGGTTKFYADGVFVGSSGNCNTGRYGGLMYINNELFGSTILDKPTVCDFVMCAFGSQYHDDATVQKNMAYLMKKYIKG